MPKLRMSSEVPSTLTQSEEMLLLFGDDLLCGWEESQRRAKWLQSPEAAQKWKRHRAQLIRQWLTRWPSELPAGSRLYDAPAQQRELQQLLKRQRAKLPRREPSVP